MQGRAVLDIALTSNLSMAKYLREYWQCESVHPPPGRGDASGSYRQGLVEEIVFNLVLVPSRCFSLLIVSTTLLSGCFLKEAKYSGRRPCPLRGPTAISSSMAMVLAAMVLPTVLAATVMAAMAMVRAPLVDADLRFGACSSRSSSVAGRRLCVIYGRVAPRQVQPQLLVAGFVAVLCGASFAAVSAGNRSVLTLLGFLCFLFLASFSGQSA